MTSLRTLSFPFTSSNRTRATSSGLNEKRDLHEVFFFFSTFSLCSVACSLRARVLSLPWVFTSRTRVEVSLTFGTRGRSLGTLSHPPQGDRPPSSISVTRDQRCWPLYNPKVTHGYMCWYDLPLLNFLIYLKA